MKKLILYCLPLDITHGLLVFFFLLSIFFAWKCDFITEENKFLRFGCELKKTKTTWGNM